MIALAKAELQQPFLTSVAAQQFVRDVPASCDFYARLGFATDFVHGAPPFYGQVSRDSVRLALKHMDEPVYAPGIRERETLLSAAITVETRAEIEALFAEFAAAQAPFQQTLQTQSWGACNFIVRDPDGNLLLFAGPADADTHA